MSAADTGYSGGKDQSTDSSEYNRLVFIVKQLMSQGAHVALAQVMAVSNTGGVAAAGTVDVQPMVHQIDGQGNATPHGTVHGISYSRLQGGVNAVIHDPAVGDIGICVFADRDISSVKANKAVANPGSRRQFDYADGMYVGGILNGVPQNFVQFDGSGNINITSGQGNVTVNSTADNVAINAPSGNVTVVANHVSLGATGGPAVARVGDTVAGGVITSGSTKVTAA